MDETRYMQNRELSWLKFNERVLQEAQDESVPLYERLKFVAIFTSNLDEFFMVRVGSLYDLSLADKNSTDNKTGLTPQQQLDRIYKAVGPLYTKKDKIYGEVSQKLCEKGICAAEYKKLSPDEKHFIDDYFYSYIFPVLSPQIVDDHHPFPFIPNKQLYIAARLQRNKKYFLGLVSVPSSLPSVVYILGDNIKYIDVSKIIYEHTKEMFELYQVLEKNLFCVTRNADINPEEESDDINEDFRNKMKKLIKKRRRLAAVRLESEHEMEEFLSEKLRQKLHLRTEQMFVSKSPMCMGYVYELINKMSDTQMEALCYNPFNPRISQRMLPVRARDSLLFYPYESMKPFLDLIRKSAYDPGVISIKITIYRLAKDAKLIEYLCAAAENGKEVQVLIELRARFDEQNNIDWSERLEQAGCRILYGFDEYKVHSKLCLITKKDRSGNLKYITQIGTGNYNEKTARLYTDLSLITENFEIGLDAATFFKNMSISNLEGDYKHLLVAPHSMKNRIIGLIDREIKKGADGQIVMKINSLTDIDIIMKLQEASSAGVRVKLLIRGICCLLPGISGVTENIMVISVVGRFLEHSRIYSFGKGEQQTLYISSADMMTRNLQRRVEVACPIYSQEIRDRLNHILEIMFADNVKARELTDKGVYRKRKNINNRIDAQEVFMKEAVEMPDSLSERNEGAVKRIYRGIITNLYRKLNDYK